MLKILYNIHYSHTIYDQLWSIHIFKKEGNEKLPISFHTTSHTLLNGSN